VQAAAVNLITVECISTIVARGVPLPASRLPSSGPMCYM
jgi:hypothetical protein